MMIDRYILLHYEEYKRLLNGSNVTSEHKTFKHDPERGMMQADITSTSTYAEDNKSTVEQVNYDTNRAPTEESELEPDTKQQEADGGWFYIWQQVKFSQ